MPLQVKSYALSDPITEFRIEASRVFLAVLDAYREAVVEKLMAPDMSLSVPVEGEIDSS